MSQADVDAMAAGGAKAKPFAKQLRASTPKEVAKRISKRKVEKTSPLPITKAKMATLKRSAKARKEFASLLERRTPSVVEPEKDILTTKKKTPSRARSGK